LAELVEDALEFLRWNPDPGVPHRDLHLRFVAARGDRHLAILRRELDGVGEQVEEDLPEFDGVGDQ